MNLYGVFMKKRLQFLYPAIFIKDEDDSYQVIFPDLNIYTNGNNMTDAYIRAQELLRVYFSYATKYETECNAPTKVEALVPKCKTNEVVMIVPANIEIDAE